MLREREVVLELQLVNFLERLGEHLGRPVDADEACDRSLVVVLKGGSAANATLKNITFSIRLHDPPIFTDLIRVLAHPHILIIALSRLIMDLMQEQLLVLDISEIRLCF